MRISRSTFIFLMISFFAVHASNEMYFVTVCDTEHFPWLKGLIESILKYNYTQTAQIAVFNLGLTQHEINELNCVTVVIALVTKPCTLTLTL